MSACSLVPIEKHKIKLNKFFKIFEYKVKN